MTDFLVQKLVKAREAGKAKHKKKIQLGFSSEIKMPQLGSATL